MLENLSNGNTRLALNILTTFLGSGHVNTQKIVDIAQESGNYTIPLHEFIRAIIYGDQLHYDPVRSPVANLLDIATPDPKEHFLLPIILEQLRLWKDIDRKSGLVTLEPFYSHIQGLGFTPEQIDASLIRAQKHKLVETETRKTVDGDGDLPLALRITSVGAYHIQKLIKQFAYLDAILVNTPIIDGKANYQSQFHDVHDIDQRTQRCLIFCDYLDDKWVNVSLGADPFDWMKCSDQVRSEIARIRRNL